MKMTIASKLVKQYMIDLIDVGDVDFNLIDEKLDKVFRTAPEIKADTIEQADILVREVMDWQKSMVQLSVGLTSFSQRELEVFLGLLHRRLDEMHLAVETLLFNLGVVERGEENTPTQDTD